MNPWRDLLSVPALVILDMLPWLQNISKLVQYDFSIILIFQSTGDSLDDEHRDSETLTRRNTSYNEVIDADNPQTPEEVGHWMQNIHSLNIEKTTFINTIALLKV